MKAPVILLRRGNQGSDSDGTRVCRRWFRRPKRHGKGSGRVRKRVAGRKDRGHPFSRPPNATGTEGYFFVGISRGYDKECKKKEEFGTIYELEKGPEPTNVNRNNCIKIATINDNLVCFEESGD